jgi:hypothetical protein
MTLRTHTAVRMAATLVATAGGLTACSGIAPPSVRVTPPGSSFAAALAAPRAPSGSIATGQPGRASAGCTHRVRVRIRKGGGTFAMPRCVGWAGTINYPPGNQNYAWSVTTSTTNDFGAPAPPNGTAIFYMQTKAVKGRSAPSFANTGVMNTVSSSAFSSDHSYSLFVYGFLQDSQCPVQPPSRCPPWVVDLGSPAPSAHTLTFVSPLNGAEFGGFSYLTPVWQFVQN